MSEYIEDERTSRPVELPADIREPSDVAYHIMHRMFHPSRKLDHEETWALFINGDEFIFHELLLRQWEQDLDHQDISEIFQLAIEDNTFQMILASIHLSGDPTPTPLDVQLTQRLRDAGDVLFIPILDHIIVAQDTWHSMREHGWDSSDT